ncbi:WSCD family member AAEL009094-like [Ischnura elegans]|uniref:WSCD family member AAEL009094-like n=1 Tax=Ischnura elegans TaxID=197161 RepID=UPI001ED878AC|nr:WSCD family member AAEL009094-like [Ischnura elegans]
MYVVSGLEVVPILRMMRLRVVDLVAEGESIWGEGAGGGGCPCCCCCHQSAQPLHYSGPRLLVAAIVLASAAYGLAALLLAAAEHHQPPHQHRVAWHHRAPPPARPSHQPAPLQSHQAELASGGLVRAGGRGLELLGRGGLGPQPRRARLHWCRPLRFLSPPGPVVALASFPGSGNTWLRYLIQQATGVFTGSVYKDYGLLKNGFPAESVVNGSVAVVKTHESGPGARAPFSRAVLLIRSPGAAIHAEFNRQSGGHVGFASPDRYRRNRGKYWQDFVADKLITWRRTNLDWLEHFRGPMHVVLYDRLVTHVEQELRALLAFLGLRAPRTAIDCALARREGIYKRRRRALPFDPYTGAMREALRAAEDQVMVALRRLLQTAAAASTTAAAPSPPTQ